MLFGREISRPSPSMSFQDLKRNLAKDFSALPVRRLALLGDTATQFLAQAIKGHGIAEKINFEIFEADFDQLNSQILDSASELYRSRPEFVVLCVSAEKLWPRLADAPLEEKPRFAETILAEIKNWWLTIAKSSSARVIQFNFIEINDGVFGNFATKTPASFPFQISIMN